MWLTYIAVLFGMLLLIVPGLYLLARWAFVPFLITLEGISPLNAFGESHRRTQRYTTSLLGVSVLSIGAIFALTLATYLPAAFILPGLDSHPVVNYIFAIAESTIWCVWVCTFFIFYKREEAARAKLETPPPLPPKPEM
jgi:sterol desaturase/sphingolipid hydroxylase (fatty acid hydroxylase superfamily)